MREKCKTVYTFDELPEDIQEKVLEAMSDINIDYGWWDFIFYDVKECAKILGIDIEQIYFSGFSSPGDGACFEGTYRYNKGSVKEIKKYAPDDKELHDIAEKLMQEQKKCMYKLEAVVKQRGHYSHSGCTDITVSSDGYYVDNVELQGILRQFMNWIYWKLEKEYKYLSSRDAIRETIVCNNYEFDSEGNLW